MGVSKIGKLDSENDLDQECDKIYDSAIPYSHSKFHSFFSSSILQVPIYPLEPS